MQLYVLSPSKVYSQKHWKFLQSLANFFFQFSWTDFEFSGLVKTMTGSRATKMEKPTYTHILHDNQWQSFPAFGQSSKIIKIP